MNIEKAKRMHKAEMIKAQKQDYKLKRDGFIVKPTDPSYKKQYFVSGWAEG